MFNYKSLNEKAYSLVGIDGNAFAIMGYVSRAMRECKHNRDEINAYLEDAKSSDYNYLLSVSIDMIEQLNQEQGYDPYHQMTKPDTHEQEEWEDRSPEESRGYSLHDIYSGVDESYDFNKVIFDKTKLY